MDGRPSAVTISRFRLGVLLTTVMAASNVIQFALGALAPVLVADLDLSRADFGLLVSAYYLFAAIASLLLGRLVDRAGARRSIAALLGLGAIAGLALAAAPTYQWLFAGLVLGGVVAALANPATNLALVAVPGRLGALVGIKQSGVQGGSLLAGLVLPPVALAWGWPAAFLVCAGVFFACLVGLAAVPSQRVTAPDTDGQATAADAAGPPARRVVPLAAYALLMGAGMATVTSYLALYAHEMVGLSTRVAGLLLAVIGAVAVLARIGWSMLADRRRTGQAWLLGTMASVAVLAAALLGIAQDVGAPLLWVGAVVAGVSGAAWNGVVMLTVIRGMPANRTAVASGQVQAAFFIGLCISPPVFGFLVDRFGSYAFGWAWTAACFVAAGLVSPLSKAGASRGSVLPRCA